MKFLVQMVLALFFVFFAAGCAALNPSKKIAKGDEATIRYICRVKGGEIIDTTDNLIAKDNTLKKSRVFSDARATGPVKLLAGQDPKGQVDDKLLDMTPEIRKQIALQLPGKSYGRTYEMTIESQMPDGMKNRNRFLFIKRTREIPRTQEKSKSDITVEFGLQNPKVGDILYKDGQPIGEIISTGEKEVTLKVLTDNGAAVETDWGTISAASGEAEDKVITTIHSQIGRLVRNGPVIGRVVDINKENIVIDFGHPFGEEKFDCEVKILEPKTRTQ